MKKGLFITLEGIEGVGKSTAMSVLTEIFAKREIAHITTREPGGTPMGERLREVLLMNSEEIVSPITECLVLFAAREQHLQTFVWPHLRQGISVICDRFTDSTFAYQGAGRGVETAHLQYLQDWVHPDLAPDLTLLLDATVETALTRARSRSELDRIEGEDMAFFKRVREAYLQRAETFAERYQVIDSNQTLDAVKQQIQHAVDLWLMAYYDN